MLVEHIVIQSVYHMGLVVQSTNLMANPGLYLNLLFWFMHFYSTVCFEPLKITALLTQKIFVERHVYEQAICIKLNYLNWSNLTNIHCLKN